MKKIKPLLCTACGVGHQQLESEHWPTVRVCRECFNTFNGFMLTHGLADQNPLYFSLVCEGDDGNYPYRLELYDGSEMLVVMGPSKFDSAGGVFGTWHVEFPIRLESEKNIENPLDTL